MISRYNNICKDVKLQREEDKRRAAAPSKRPSANGSKASLRNRSIDLSIVEDIIG
jgi:hypothetical protein